MSTIQLSDLAIEHDESTLMEFRCNGCWNSNCVPISLANQWTTCSHCRQSVEVPSATPERIERASQHATSSIPVQTNRSNGSLRTANDSAVINPYATYSDQDEHIELPMASYAGLSLASRSTRLIANIADTLVIVAGVMFGALLLHYAIQQRWVPTVQGSQKIQVTQCVVLFAPLVLAQLMQWTLLGTMGQTIGKLICGIRVVTNNGRRAGFIRAVIVRDIIGYALRATIPFLALIDILFIFGSSKRCLHDYLAGTSVVSAY